MVARPHPHRRRRAGPSHAAPGAQDPCGRRSRAPLFGGHDQRSGHRATGLRRIHPHADLAHIVLTDSAGVQKEAPNLESPALGMRDITKPRARESGNGGIDPYERGAARGPCEPVLHDSDPPEAMANAANHHGEDRA
ncbi:UDP-N-acetylglucosamine 2-epimerase [Paenarthrobacter nitroguajacolicus]|uniref:UDP-N-acetylglucosamine 2-epimerase n=1 Tax=Paenarthrobacter nitroguajacolicus TaxID=211146 RepID=UPI00343EAA48